MTKKSELDDLEPVQAQRNSPHNQMAPTERARAVAAFYRWCFTWEDKISNEAGVEIAGSIEELHDLLAELGAFIGEGFVDWKSLPNDGDELARQLRALS